MMCDAVDGAWSMAALEVEHKLWWNYTMTCVTVESSRIAPAPHLGTSTQMPLLAIASPGIHSVLRGTLIVTVGGTFPSTHVLDAFSRHRRGVTGRRD
jgi:hypothetical protein